MAALWSKIRSFLAFYILGVVSLLKQIFTWKSLQSKTNLPKFPTKGKNVRPLALITGGTRGIGFELANLLAQDGFDLILAARDQRDGSLAVDKITKQNPGCSVEFFSIDLSNIEGVKQFADAIKQRRGKLNLLINNAALMMTPFKIVDGFEWQWATNVVAPIILCESLLDILERGEKEDGLGRIINVASSAHFAQQLTINYIMNPPESRNYSSHLAYANSKVAIIIYTEELQKRLFENDRQVRAFSLHPGVIVTDLYKYVNPIMTVLTWPMSRSAKEAAYDMRYMCYHDDIAPGKYFENGRQTEPSFVNANVRRAFVSFIDSLKEIL